MVESVLIVDVGTSKVHTNLIGLADGKHLESKAYSYQWVHPAEGWSEINALDIWESAQKAVEEIVEAVKGKYEIQAIGFSYIGDSLILVGEDTDPIGNLILAFDNRAKEEAQQIADEFGEEGLKKVGGFPIMAEWVPAKVLWLKKNKPEEYKRAAYVLSIQQFMNLKLGLGIVTDYTMACRKIMYEIEGRKWSEPLCSYLGLPINKVGTEVISADSMIGTINKFGRVDLGKDIPVFLGAHDSESGMIGLGVIPGSDAVLGNITGTYDHIGYLLGKPVNNLEGFFGSFCGPLDGSFVLMGASIAGPSLDWFIRTFHAKEGLAAINRLFDEYPMDGTNKTILTKGVQTGDGTIRGINLETTQGNLFQAIIEGVTFPLANVVKQLEKVNGNRFGCLRIGGGGAQSHMWSQFKADLFNMRVEKVQNIEISSMGAAVMAAVGLGYYPDYATAMQHMIGIETVYEPRPEITKRYGERLIEYLNA